MKTQAGLLRRGRREVIDVPEARRLDPSLDRLLHVRKQRLGRLERERGEARQRWRDGRASLRATRLAGRAAHAAAAAFWQAARAGFLAMGTTSGEFRQAKAAYERMKEDAARILLRWHEELAGCRTAQQEFFDRHDAVLRANRQQEKLGILRDELRRQALAAQE